MLYDTIKGVCKDKKLSISAVEKEAKLGNGTISKWNKSSPQTDNLQAVAAVLNVKIDKLLEGGTNGTTIQTAIHSN